MDIAGCPGLHLGGAGLGQGLWLSVSRFMKITSYLLQGCHRTCFLTGDFTARPSPSKISCSLGKAAVKWLSGEVTGPKLQLSDLPCTSPGVLVLWGEQIGLVSSGDAELAGPRGLR